jgi:hypothetical protein
VKAGVQLFVGGDGSYINGERIVLHGQRCFSAVHRPRSRLQASQVIGLLDSGAFSDPPAARLTVEAALERQLRWESKASHFWGARWQAHALVSYDLLIDEVWSGTERHKRRWSVSAAEQAVTETIAAAAYLASQRGWLRPRRLVLACQGVDAVQYEECVVEVLRYAGPADWLGLGGWCILGRWRSWLPIFWATLWRIIPRIALSGVRHVHIFGVLWPIALGGLLWLADSYGLTVSTDSSAPLLSALWKDQKKAGAKAQSWQGNVRYWQTTLAQLRATPHYRRPPVVAVARQECFL